MHLFKNDQSLERLYIYSVTYIVKARLNLHAKQKSADTQGEKRSSRDLKKRNIVYLRVKLMRVISSPSSSSAPAT